MHAPLIFLLCHLQIVPHGLKDSDSKEESIEWIGSRQPRVSATMDVSGGTRQGDLERMCEVLPLHGGGEICTYPQTSESLLLSRSVVLRIRGMVIKSDCTL